MGKIERLDQVSGFTLIEMLVALTLTSIMLVALKMTFSQVFASVVHSQSILQKNSSHGIALAILEADIKRIYTDNKRVLPFTVGDGSETDTGKTLLSFATTHSLEEDNHDPHLVDIYCIEYQLRENEEEESKLTFIRRERPFCGISGNFEWSEYALFEELESAEVRYYDPSWNDFVEGWSKKTPPAALSFNFVFADQHKIDFPIILDPEARP